MRAFSSNLDRALALAASAHRHQERKGSGVPYITHPVHAAMILIKYNFPEDAVVAAVLHDVVEDTDVPLAEIGRQFGQAVQHLVDQVSEVKHAAATPTERLPWPVRKQEQLARLGHADPLTAAVKSADALHNCHSMLQDLTKDGPAAWQRFRSTPEEQIWYYSTLAALLRTRLGGHPISDELDEAVSQLQRLQREHSDASVPRP
jgi:(p)ppGpp synthase/HD superfamily hydrolase